MIDYRYVETNGGPTSSSDTLDAEPLAPTADEEQPLPEQGNQNLMLI